MLGRQHFSITLATLIPFVIPLFFLYSKNFLVYALFFLIAAMFGSLLPDSDCRGNTTLCQKFGPIDIIMKLLRKIAIWLFNEPKVRERLNVTKIVNEEHRGIMHSPIGALISSFVLTLPALIFLLLPEGFGLGIMLGIFFGLFIGQILHLLEDSCTITGINWKFPFSHGKLSGKIYTFEKFEGQRDIRPLIFQYALGIVSILLFVGYASNQIDVSIGIFYGVLTAFITFIWWIFFSLAQGSSEFWYQDARFVEAATLDKSKFKILLKPAH